jgi:hypothetical protein
MWEVVYFCLSAASRAVHNDDSCGRAVQAGHPSCGPALLIQQYQSNTITNVTALTRQTFRIF